MLQPKKLNPSQKNRKLTSGNTTPASYDVDWDAVRSVNDNVVVQAAKIFDPIGISSYPDVYYAGKDLYEGKGSVGNLALNVLGALPMVGKAKVLFNLAKARNASRTVTGVKKVFKGVEKVAEKVNKVTNPLDIPSPFKLKNQRTASKQISKVDVKNLGVDLLDLANVGADVSSVVKAGTPVVEEASKIIKKELETPSPIDKNKIIEYYNTDPKRGEVEKPGQLANVQYVPVSNSAELGMWQKQKLALGTGKDGLMKTKMNLRKKYAAGTGVNGVKNYIPNPADALAENNKMMAEAEMTAMQNPWLPIVGIAGGLASTAIGSGVFNKPGTTRPAVTTVDAGLTMAPMAALGMQDSEENEIEVEGGEVMETPDGQVQELEGAAHEDGGIPLDNVPQGTDIFSDRLKGKDGKTMAERKMAREKKRSNLLDMISTNSTDLAVKNTAQRKMGFLDKEEQEDKQMQEIANQIQQLQQAANNMEVADMNPSQEEFMYGTGSQGMKYAYGTGADGVTEYALGGTIDPITGKIYNTWLQNSREDLLKRYSPNASSEDKMFKSTNPNIRKEFQTFLFGNKAGTVDGENNYTIDGDFGKTTNASAKQYSDIYDHYSNIFDPSVQTDVGYGEGGKKPGWKIEQWKKEEQRKLDLEKDPSKAPSIVGAGTEMDFAPQTGNPSFDWKSMPEVPSEVMSGKEGIGIADADRLASAEEDAAFYTPGQVGTPIEDLPGNMFSRGVNKMANKIGELNEGGFIPGIGDMMKFYGNYKAGTDSMKNALENYAKTPAEVNAYKNFGKESLREVDLMKENIAGQRDFAQQKLNAQARAAKKAGASGARGINVQRALSLASDYQNIQGTNELTANVLQQLMGLQGTKADLLTKRDAMVMKGEEDKNERILKNMDAFYTAKGKAYKDQSMAVQTSGKDFNTMQMNQILLKLLQSQSPNFGITRAGEITTKK
jgi:hypothetical protein